MVIVLYAVLSFLGLCLLCLGAALLVARILIRDTLLRHQDHWRLRRR